MSGNSQPVKLNRFEDRGYFVEFTFDDEDDSTVLFIADRDFESLQKLANNESKSWEDFREEIFELLDHSGHEGNHELGESKTKDLQNQLANFEADISTSD